LAELSGVGSVVITRDGKPVGIITDREIALKITMKMKNRIPGEIKAKEIMSSPLITIEPDTPVECELVAIKRLPVIENGILIGIGWH